MIYLPKELVREILKYAIGECDCCNEERKFNELKREIMLEDYGVVCGYRYIKSYKYYRYICLKCFDNEYHLKENSVLHKL